MKKIKNKLKIRKILIAYLAILVVIPLALLSFSPNNKKPENVFITAQKQTFQAGEDAVFNVDIKWTKRLSMISQAFAQEHILDPEFTSPDGNIVKVETKITQTDSDSFTIEASPPKALTPGKYQMNLEVEGTDKVYTQNFTWGVLALNTNKSVYNKGETAKISIAVLNDEGYMVCDADVILKVTLPDGRISTLTTKDKSIKVTDQCHTFEMSLEPDYMTGLSLSSEGKHVFELSATTKSGTHTIKDFILVEDRNLVVERNSATRVYPFNKYPMNINITPDKDLKGVIEEIVPKEFAVVETNQDEAQTDYAAKVIEKKDHKVIQWEVDWKKGSKHNITYTYDAPNISPQFYILGKLTFTSGSESYVLDDRYWMIANDAVGTLRPDGDITVTENFANCVTNGNGNCRFGVVDESAEIAGDYVGTGTANDDGTGGDEEEFSMQSVAGSFATITNVDVKFQAQSIACNGSGGSPCDSLTVRIFIDGAYETGQTQVLTASDALYTLSFPGTWSGDDDLQIEFARNILGGGPNASKDDDVRIYQAWAEVTYTAVDVTGNVYNANTSNALTECDADSGTHELSLRTNSTTYTTSCSSTDGSYTFSNVAAGSAGSGMVFWIDDAQAPETDGALAMRYDGSGNSTGNTFYDDTVTITSDDTNGVTNAIMDTYDSGNDADIPYTVTTNNLTVNSAYELLVKIKSGVAAGSTVYAPEGTVTTNATGGDLHLDDNSDATLDTDTNSIGRDILIDTGATLTVNFSTTVGGGDITVTGTLDTTAGTPTITTRGTGNISGAGTKTVYNLRIGDATTATTTLTGALTANNNVSVGTDSTLNINANLTVTGSLTNTTTGIINHTANSPIVTVSGSSIGGGSGNLTFYRLQKAGAGTTTFTGSGTNTINDTLDATAGTFTLNTNNVITVARNISASNSATLNQDTALTITGGNLLTSGTGIIDTTSGTGTVTLSGTGSIGGGGTVTVYNLAINGNQTLASATTSDTDVAIATGASLALGNQNLTVTGGDFTTTGTGSITCSGCSAGTVTMSSTGSLGGGNGNITFYNLETSGTGTTTFTGGGTNSVTNNVTVGAGTTLTIGSSIAITGNLTNTTTGIIASSGTPTVTIQGTTLGSGSGDITIYNLIKSGAGTTTFSGSGTNTITTNLAVSAGTLTQSNTLTVTGDISVATGATFNTNATLNVNGGDLTTAGTGVVNTTAGTATTTLSGTGNIGGGGTVTVYTLALTGAGTHTLQSATVTNNDLTIATGQTLELNSISLTVSGGDLTTAGTGSVTCASCTAGTLTISGSGTLGGGGTITAYNLTVNGTQSASSALLANRLLTIGGSGSLAMGANNLTVGSSSVANSGGIANSGTITQSSSATTTILSSSGGTASVGGSGSTTFYNLTIAPTVASAPTITLGTAASQTINVTNTFTIGNGSNDVTVTAASNDPTLNVDGNFSISSTGAFTSTGGLLTVAGNFSNSGTFAHDSGTVQIDGSGTSTLSGTGSPAITFHNFTANTASKSLDFTAGQTFRVNGLLTLDGQNIDSTTASQWFINHQGTESVTNSTITNSGCDGSSTLITVDVSDTSGGNNGSCWDFASVIYPNPVRAVGPLRISGNVRMRD